MAQALDGGLALICRDWRSENGGGGATETLGLEAIGCYRFSLWLMLVL
jgi:hypothetical protein